MPIDNYFDTVWAVDGDVTTIPDALDPSGFVSFDQGYTANYQSPSGTYPVERDKFNYLMNQVTLAIQTYQRFGTPPFITSTMNGGSPFSYSKFARVLSGGIVYTSLIDSNVDTPPTANWTTGNDVPAGGTGLNTLTAHYLLVGAGASPVGLIAPSAASGLALVSKGVSADPAYDTVIVAGGGTGSTTAAGARANLGIAPYISAQQTITNAGTLTLAHGLGSVPVRWAVAYLVCQSSEFGYTAGDFAIPLVDHNTTNGFGYTAGIKADATNLNIKYGSSGFGIINFTNGQFADATSSSWKAVFYASLI